MENNKDDKYYIEKTKVHFERILDTIENVSYDEFVNDLEKQRKVIIRIKENN